MYEKYVSQLLEKGRKNAINKFLSFKLHVWRPIRPTILTVSLDKKNKNEFRIAGWDDSKLVI